MLGLPVDAEWGGDLDLKHHFRNAFPPPLTEHEWATVRLRVQDHG